MDDESTSSSLLQEKLILSSSNRLHNQSISSKTAKCKEKVILTKPKQLCKIKDSVFKIQCQQMRIKTQNSLTNKAVKAIMKLRKIKQKDYTNTIIRNLETHVSEFQKLCLILSSSCVKNWITKTIEKIVDQ
jgi:hypothetical protein